LYRRASPHPDLRSPTFGAHPTLLLTGASGLVGAALCRHAFAKFRVVAAIGRGAPPSLKRGDRAVRVDLESAGAANRLFESVEPHAVVHAAALSALGACEADPARARRLNVDATRELANAAARSGAWLAFLSTDQLFDGEPTRAPFAGYVEEDATAPVNVYGRTKLEAEAAVSAAGGDALVIRTSLVVGGSPGSSLDAGRSAAFDSVRLAPAGATLRLFADEFRTPVSAIDLARVIDAAARARTTGVVHVGGPDRVDRLELGRRIAALFGRDRGPGALTLVAARRADAGHPRPRDVSLCCDRLAALALPRPQPLDDGLAELARDGAD
jgi:dTDP-4-dehydrorhamnose reductase